MLSFLLAVFLAASLSPSVIPPPDPVPTVIRSYAGFAAGYSPGLMGRVARNRQMPLVDCMVSSDLAKIGTWLIVISDLDGEQRLCRVTDQSAGVDLRRHLRERLYIEFDAP